jgi:hypothetical protein
MVKEMMWRLFNNNEICAVMNRRDRVSDESKIVAEVVEEIEWADREMERVRHGLMERLAKVVIGSMESVARSQARDQIEKQRTFEYLASVAKREVIGYYLNARNKREADVYPAKMQLSVASLLRKEVKNRQFLEVNRPQSTINIFKSHNPFDDCYREDDESLVDMMGMAKSKTLKSNLKDELQEKITYNTVYFKSEKTVFDKVVQLNLTKMKGSLEGGDSIVTDHRNRIDTPQMNRSIENLLEETVEMDSIPMKNQIDMEVIENLTTHSLSVPKDLKKEEFSKLSSIGHIDNNSIGTDEEENLRIYSENAISVFSFSNDRIVSTDQREIGMILWSRRNEKLEFIFTQDGRIRSCIKGKTAARHLKEFRYECVYQGAKEPYPNTSRNVDLHKTSLFFISSALNLIEMNTTKIYATIMEKKVKDEAAMRELEVEIAKDVEDFYVDKENSDLWILTSKGKIYKRGDEDNGVYAGYLVQAKNWTCIYKANSCLIATGFSAASGEVHYAHYAENTANIKHFAVKSEFPVMRMRSFETQSKNTYVLAVYFKKFVDLIVENGGRIHPISVQVQVTENRKDWISSALAMKNSDGQSLIYLSGSSWVKSLSLTS